MNEKEVEVTKGMPPDATKPPAVPQDSTKDNEASKMEIVLATLLIPAKGDLKGTAKDPRRLQPNNLKLLLKEKS